jgi:hypothetical protein
MPVRDLTRDHWIARQHDEDVAAARSILETAREEGAGTD